MNGLLSSLRFITFGFLWVLIMELYIGAPCWAIQDGDSNDAPSINLMSLPDELIIETFSHLDAPSLSDVFSVNKRLRRLAETPRNQNPAYEAYINSIKIEKNKVLSKIIDTQSIPLLKYYLNHPDFNFDEFRNAMEKLSLARNEELVKFILKHGAERIATFPKPTADSLENETLNSSLFRSKRDTNDNQLFQEVYKTFLNTPWVNEHLYSGRPLCKFYDTPHFKTVLAHNPKVNRTIFQKVFKSCDLETFNTLVNDHLGKRADLQDRLPLLLGQVLNELAGQKPFLQCHQEMLNLLLNKFGNGKILEIVGNQPQQILKSAALAGNFEIARLLLEGGVPPIFENKPLAFYAAGSSLPLLTYLLEEGVNKGRKLEDGFLPEVEDFDWNRLLLEAAGSGNLENVKYLVGRGMSINYTRMYRSPLTIAATEFHGPLLTYLARHGADPKLLENELPGSMCSAINSIEKANYFNKKAYSFITEMLDSALILKIDWNKVRCGGSTLLEYAVEVGNFQAANLLMDREVGFGGKDIDADHLMKLLHHDTYSFRRFRESTQDYIDFVLRLIGLGAQVTPDLIVEIHMTLESLNLPDFEEAFFNNKNPIVLDLTKFFYFMNEQGSLNHEAKPIFVKKYRPNSVIGELSFPTPLGLTIDLNKRKEAEQLLSMGASPNKRVKWLKLLSPSQEFPVTGIQLAVLEENKDLTQLFLEHGGKIKAGSLYGYSGDERRNFYRILAAHAASMGHIGILEQIHGGKDPLLPIDDLVTTSLDGETPVGYGSPAISFAIYNKQLEAVKKLLELGADPTIKSKFKTKNSHPNTPMGFAVGTKDRDIIHLVREAVHSKETRIWGETTLPDPR